MTNLLRRFRTFEVNFERSVMVRDGLDSIQVYEKYTSLFLCRCRLLTKIVQYIRMFSVQNAREMTEQELEDYLQEQQMEALNLLDETQRRFNDRAGVS